MHICLLHRPESQSRDASSRSFDRGTTSRRFPFPFEEIHLLQRTQSPRFPLYKPTSYSRQALALQRGPRKPRTTISAPRICTDPKSPLGIPTYEHLHSKTIELFKGLHFLKKKKKEPPVELSPVHSYQGPKREGRERTRISYSSSPSRSGID